MVNVSICGSRVIVNSFVEGGRIKKLTPPRRVSVEDILAHALWLESHRGTEAADEFLTNYCRNHPPVVTEN